MLRNTFWFNFLAAIQNPAVGVCILNWTKLRSWGLQTLDESWTWANVKLSALCLKSWSFSLGHEGIQHPCPFLHLRSLIPHWEPSETPSAFSEPLLSPWVWWSGGQWASWQPMDAQISFSVRPLSHTSPVALFSAHKKGEKWKTAAGSFLSCPGEEEKITLKVKQNKPPTGYMTPSLHSSFRKEIFLRLL